MPDTSSSTNKTVSAPTVQVISLPGADISSPDYIWDLTSENVTEWLHTPNVYDKSSARAAGRQLAKGKLKIGDNTLIPALYGTQYDFLFGSENGDQYIQNQKDHITPARVTPGMSEQQALSPEELRRYFNQGFMRTLNRPGKKAGSGIYSPTLVVRSRKDAKDLAKKFANGQIEGIGPELVGTAFTPTVKLYAKSAAEAATGKLDENGYVLDENGEIPIRSWKTTGDPTGDVSRLFYKTFAEEVERLAALDEKKTRKAGLVELMSDVGGEAGEQAMSAYTKEGIDEAAQVIGNTAKTAAEFTNTPLGWAVRGFDFGLGMYNALNTDDEYKGIDWGSLGLNAGMFALNALHTPKVFKDVTKPDLYSPSYRLENKIPDSSTMLGFYRENPQLFNKMFSSADKEALESMIESDKARAISRAERSLQGQIDKAILEQYKEGASPDAEPVYTYTNNQSPDTAQPLEPGTASEAGNRPFRYFSASEVPNEVPAGNSAEEILEFVKSTPEYEQRAQQLRDFLSSYYDHLKTHSTAETVADKAHGAASESGPHIAGQLPEHITTQDLASAVFDDAVTSDSNIFSQTIQLDQTDVSDATWNTNGAASNNALDLASITAKGFSNSTARQMEASFALKRPAMTAAQRSAFYDSLSGLCDEAARESIPALLAPKAIQTIKSNFQRAVFRWALDDAINLPDDNENIKEALSIARKYNLNLMDFSSPVQIIDDYAERKFSSKKVTPEDYPDFFTDKVEYPSGLTIYTVADSYEAQNAMREIMNWQFGTGSSPWCLLKGDSKTGELIESARGLWDLYSTDPRRAAFYNGRLVSFYAGSENVSAKWYDRLDEPSVGIPYTKGVPGSNGIIGTYHFDEQTGALTSDPPTNLHRGSNKSGKYETFFDDLTPHTVSFRKILPDGSSALQGRMLTYSHDASGKNYLISEENFSNDKKEGISTFFYPDGTKYLETNYHYGKEKGKSLYNQYGKLILSENGELPDHPSDRTLFDYVKNPRKNFAIKASSILHSNKNEYVLIGNQAYGSDTLFGKLDFVSLINGKSGIEYSYNSLGQPYIFAPRGKNISHNDIYPHFSTKIIYNPNGDGTYKIISIYGDFILNGSEILPDKNSFYHPSMYISVDPKYDNIASNPRLTQAQYDSLPDFPDRLSGNETQELTNEDFALIASEARRFVDGHIDKAMRTRDAIQSLFDEALKENYDGGNIMDHVECSGDEIRVRQAGQGIVFNSSFNLGKPNPQNYTNPITNRPFAPIKTYEKIARFYKDNYASLPSPVKSTLAALYSKKYFPIQGDYLEDTFTFNAFLGKEFTDELLDALNKVYSNDKGFDIFKSHNYSPYYKASISYFYLFALADYYNEYDPAKIFNILDFKARAERELDNKVGELQKKIDDITQSDSFRNYEETLNNINTLKDKQALFKTKRDNLIDEISLNILEYIVDSSDIRSDVHSFVLSLLENSDDIDSLINKANLFFDRYSNSILSDKNYSQYLDLNTLIYYSTNLNSLLSSIKHARVVLLDLMRKYNLDAEDIGLIFSAADVILPQQNIFLVKSDVTNYKYVLGRSQLRDYIQKYFPASNLVCNFDDIKLLHDEIEDLIFSIGNSITLLDKYNEGSKFINIILSDDLDNITEQPLNRIINSAYSHLTDTTGKDKFMRHDFTGSIIQKYFWDTLSNSAKSSIVSYRQDLDDKVYSLNNEVSKLDLEIAKEEKKINPHDERSYIGLGAAVSDKIVERLNNDYNLKIKSKNIPLTEYNPYAHYNAFVKDKKGELIIQGLTSGKTSVPVLDSSCNVSGEKQFVIEPSMTRTDGLVGLKNNFPSEAEAKEYQKIMQDNTYAVMRLTNGLPFGSSVMAALGFPLSTGDLSDVVVPRSTATSLVGSTMPSFNGKDVVPYHLGSAYGPKIDINIMDQDGYYMREYFRLLHPDKFSELYSYAILIDKPKKDFVSQNRTLNKLKFSGVTPESLIDEFKGTSKPLSAMSDEELHGILMKCGSKTFADWLSVHLPDFKSRSTSNQLNPDPFNASETKRKQSMRVIGAILDADTDEKFTVLQDGINMAYRLLLGEGFKTAPDLRATAFSDPARNKEFLLKIGIPLDVADDPNRMQLVFDYWFNNRLLSSRDVVNAANDLSELEHAIGDRDPNDPYRSKYARGTNTVIDPDYKQNHYLNSPLVSVNTQIINNTLYDAIANASSPEEIIKAIDRFTAPDSMPLNDNLIKKIRENINTLKDANPLDTMRAIRTKLTNLTEEEYMTLSDILKYDMESNPEGFLGITGNPYDPGQFFIVLNNLDLPKHIIPNIDSFLSLSNRINTHSPIKEFDTLSAETVTQVIPDILAAYNKATDEISSIQTQLNDTRGLLDKATIDIMEQNKTDLTNLISALRNAALVAVAFLLAGSGFALGAEEVEADLLAKGGLLTSYINLFSNASCQKTFLSFLQ